MQAAPGAPPLAGNPDPRGDASLLLRPPGEFSQMRVSAQAVRSASGYLRDTDVDFRVQSSDCRFQIANSIWLSRLPSTRPTRPDSQPRLSSLESEIWNRNSKISMPQFSVESFHPR